jgi:hypothetical protein
MKLFSFLMLTGILGLGYVGANGQCTPVTKNVSGGGILPCSGGTANVVLEQAEFEVHYILYKNNVEVTGSSKYNNSQALPNLTWAVSTTGTYTVKAYLDGCSSTTRYDMVGSATVNSTTPTNISISSPDPSNNVCENTGYSLNATGGSGYTWYANVTMDYPINQASIHPDLTGTYYVTGYNNCGTLQTSNNITVTIRNNVMPPSVPTVAPGYTQITCRGAHADTQYTSSAINSSSYSWSIDGGHSVSSSGLVTWNANFSGTATLRVYAYGCGTTQSTPLSINVSTLPAATLSAEGNTNLCVGETASITLTGDPLLDPDASYTFLRDGATNAGHFFGHDANDQAIASISLPESIPGTYTAVASNDGCTNVPMNGSVTITRKNPSALTIIPSTDLSQLCEGEAVTLTATGSSNTVWVMRGEGNEPDISVHISGAPPNTYSPVESGVYFARGTDVNCDTQIQSTDESVIFWKYPVVSLSPSETTTICTTCNVVINASQATSFGYVWKKNGVVIGGASSYSYTTNQPGFYSVNVSSHNCTTTSDTLEVKLNQVPVADGGQDLTVYVPPVQAIRRPANYSDADGSVTGFHWAKLSGPPVTIADANNPVLIVSDFGVGTYSFRLTVIDNVGDVATDDFLMSVVQRPDNYNYLKEETVTVAGKVTTADVESAAVAEKTVNTSYVDGLGRGLQTIQWKASPQTRDLVQPMTYDQYGREMTRYLPYVSGTDGQFKTDFVRKEDPLYGTSSNPQYQFYQTGEAIAQDAAPYAETEFENSPVNRVLRQGAAGTAWQLNTSNVVTKNYLTNGDTTVFCFNYDPTKGDVYLSAGAVKYYQANTLLCNKTIDEQGNDVLEYIDKLGRTVCKKVKAPGNKYASTYYVYDDLGNLVIVIPPEGLERIINGN